MATPVFLPGESQGQGAWWAAVYAVAQSRTWLKRFSSSSSSSSSDYITSRWRLAGDTLSGPSWCLCQKLSLSPLYFNKSLLQKSSERSSLISHPGLNSSPLEAKNPGVFSWVSNNLSDHSGFVGRSFLIVKTDRESFWHRHQKGDGECPTH